MSGQRVGVTPHQTKDSKTETHPQRREYKQRFIIINHQGRVESS